MCISVVANSILLKKYEAIKIIFIRVYSLTRKTFGLEIILWRGLITKTGDSETPRQEAGGKRQTSAGGRRQLCSPHSPLHNS